jgi:hypothetical protein
VQIMLDSPLTVINETLEHLHGLSELLLDEVKGCAARDPNSLSRVGCARKRCRQSAS